MLNHLCKIKMNQLLVLKTNCDMETPMNNKPLFKEIVINLILIGGIVFVGKILFQLYF